MEAKLILQRLGELQNQLTSVEGLAKQALQKIHQLSMEAKFEIEQWEIAEKKLKDERG